MSTPSEPLTEPRTAHFVIGALTLVALYVAQEILVPVALAILLSFILTPTVRWLERHSLQRIPSVLTVVLFTSILTGSVGYLVTNQVLELSQRLPAYKGNLIRKVRAVNHTAKGTLGRASETIQAIGDEIAGEPSGTSDAESPPSTTDEAPRRSMNLWDYFVGEAGRSLTRSSPRDDDAVKVKVVALPPSPLQQIRGWLGPIMVPLTTSGLVVVLTLFLLLNHDKMRDRILRIAGTTNLRTTTEAIDDATRRVSGLLQMQLAINTCYGVCIAIGLYAIGLPNAILWGVIGLVLRFLPYVGPWLVAAFPITLSLAVFDDWTHVGFVVALFVVLELVVNMILEPWLYGASMGVSSIGVIIAAIFWTWLWGPIGLVLAMPLTVCLVVAGKYVPALRFVSVLFGDGATLTLPERYYQRLLALDDDEADRLIAEAAAQTPVEDLYAKVLLPALRMAEVDRHASMLKPSQVRMVWETTREIVEELAGNSNDALTVEPTNRTPSPVSVLCVPARDTADEIVAMMIGDILTSCGIRSATASTGVLASEIADEASGYDVVLISAVPPAVSRQLSYLCKRLRRRHPDLPIVVAVWDDSLEERQHSRLMSSGANVVIHEPAQVVTTVRTISRRSTIPVSQAPAESVPLTQ